MGRHITPTTTPAMQNYLNPQYETPDSLYKTEFDIHCPSAVTTGLNANKSGCVTRLAMAKIPKCCRDCKGIKDNPEPARQKRGNLPAVKREIKQPVLICGCGNKKEAIKKRCDECKEKVRVETNRFYKDKQKKDRSFCKRCNKQLSKATFKYCSHCSPIVKAENRARTNQKRREQYAKENKSGLMN